MRPVRLILPQGDVRRWHRALVEKLARDGRPVAVEVGPAPAPTASLGRLETFERTLLRRRMHLGPLDRANEGGLPLGLPPAADEMVVDLTGAAAPRAGALAPTFDGSFGDDARDAVLLEGRAPALELVDHGGAPPLAMAWALPAVDRPWTLANGRAAVATRIATMVEMAASDAPAAPRRACAPKTGPAGRGAVGFARDLALDGVRRRLKRLVVDDHHWRIGWRPLGAGPSTMERLNWPEAAGWRWLQDDRKRYFADPFPFEKDGRLHVFCEDFRYETGLGALVGFEVGRDGAPGPVVPILEEDVHFSYPFVFEHAGQTWLMPETCGSRDLRLYRATRYPDRWTLDRTLLSDVAISDATIFEAEGRHWLVGATDEGGSSWDCLAIFSGPGPLGPWTREGGTPALVDASSARPAGRVVRVGGELLRPAQDCTTGYGGGLSICRVDATGGAGAFAQTVLARLGPPPGIGAHGAHTLNVAGGFEFIDALIPRRWRGRPDDPR